MLFVVSVLLFSWDFKFMISSLKNILSFNIHYKINPHVSKRFTASHYQDFVTSRTYCYCHTLMILLDAQLFIQPQLVHHRQQYISDMKSNHGNGPWTYTVFKQCPLVLSEFNQNEEKQTNSKKNTKHKILWKSVQWKSLCSLLKDTHFSQLLKNCWLNRQYHKTIKHWVLSLFPKEMLDQAEVP